ncbi:hypothetical protein FHS23_000049 [Prauserella isguenensis]|uniref:Uncharacterized protein n=1 Tax=Prauserella isguenensis TaxID=1470180 RepID=A0A839RVG5_9PSEU|nr:hypothetical protein [Prauserella isguenensis]MBB3049054.1 hypothetical protein [Prauserella isguenensis]
MAVPAVVDTEGESSEEPAAQGSAAQGRPGPSDGGSVADTVARLASLPGVGTAGDIASVPRPVSPAGSPEPEVTRTAGTGTAGTDDRVLPVAPALAELVPWGGLRRGSTVSVSGSTSLLLAFLAEATARGSWAAVVGMPELGVVAARELGVAVHRLALIPRPGAELPQVTAALLDGIDLVVVPAGGAGGSRDPNLARRLSARARNRGAVLLTAGSWPGTEVELRCAAVSWSGVDDGYGHLAQREVLVEAAGRRGAARSTRTPLLLPGPDGTIARADTAGAHPPLREVRAG